MEGDKEDPVIETSDAISAVAEDATESFEMESMKAKSQSREASADSVPPITSYQIKPVLQDK